jgi:hypothetical protein
MGGQDRLGSPGVELRRDPVCGQALGARPRFGQRRVRWHLGQLTSRYRWEDLQPEPPSAVELVRAAEDDRTDRPIGPQRERGEGTPTPVSSWR